MPRSGATIRPLCCTEPFERSRETSVSPLRTAWFSSVDAGSCLIAASPCLWVQVDLAGPHPRRPTVPRLAGGPPPRGSAGRGDERPPSSDNDSSRPEATAVRRQSARVPWMQPRADPRTNHSTVRLESRCLFGTSRRIAGAVGMRARTRELAPIDDEILLANGTPVEPAFENFPRARRVAGLRRE
jgi:hypothetical protein